MSFEFSTFPGGKLRFFNSQAGRLFAAASCFVVLAALPAVAQTPAPQPASAPDVLLLVDGEKLIGHLESGDATSITFKSDLAGEVKVDWSKIQNLQTSEKFAVALKGMTFTRHDDPAKVPQGDVTVADQKVTVTPDTGTPQVVPVANTQNVIPQASFMNAFKHAKLSQDWHGAASAGFALVQATQRSRTLTSALSLIRTQPSEGWIDPRYRTTLDFESAYGNNDSGGQVVKTNVIHAGLEQDQYLNKRLFAYGDLSFDHNYSQGLSLQYTIGLGLGVVAYKDAHQELDFKGQIAYIEQNFSVGKSNHLVGAIIGETYNRNMLRGLTLHQELSVTPSFNESSDYSANFVANLGVPISKKFNMTFGVIDGFLNDPPPGFEKNSFEFITNLTYKIN
jgi:hypothetical protein